MKHTIIYLVVIGLMFSLNVKIGYATEYHALLVGIEDYQYINDLRFCIDDVEDMKAILLTFPNYHSANITILTNSHASKSKIKSELQEMEALSSEDVLVFHFSGHGSKDNSHSYLCPWDTKSSNYGTMIKDEDFKSWMNKIPAKKL
ncbi:MAG TPA: caspase family protein [bacterium (Candidatus Stahlbacteria)]|nr:caspase family protein [Candidatus Stahlbacteria bacterium]